MEEHVHGDVTFKNIWKLRHEKINKKADPTEHPLYDWVLGQQDEDYINRLEEEFIKQREADLTSSLREEMRRIILSSDAVTVRIPQEGKVKDVRKVAISDESQGFNVVLSSEGEVIGLNEQVGDNSGWFVQINWIDRAEDIIGGIKFDSQFFADPERPFFGVESKEINSVQTYRYPSIESLDNLVQALKNGEIEPRSIRDRVDSIIQENPGAYEVTDVSIQTFATNNPFFQFDKL